MADEIIKPGQGILYMKVGVHARESLEEIIERKAREIERAGYALWGYGGGTCHPRTMVQPFGAIHEKRGASIYLCMEEINSKHFAEPLRAEEYSVDGRSWEKIPTDINVLGSRFALAIKELRKVEFDLSLPRTQVALGNSVGASGDKYIRGRVDKACLEILDDQGRSSEKERDSGIAITLVAEVVKPYAVFVRGPT